MKAPFLIAAILIIDHRMASVVRTLGEVMAKVREMTSFYHS